MSTLVIEGLRASVAGHEVLKGIDLVVPAGEVHAIMGPHGSGKSTLGRVLAGHPSYEVVAGSAMLDDVELLPLSPWQRAEAGLFLALQHPTEVPGVALRDVFRASGRTPDEADEIDDRVRNEAFRIGFDTARLSEPLNMGLSEGEKKRNEALQFGVLRPTFAVLDELESGLDPDGLLQVSSRIEAATNDSDLGVLVLTRSSRLFDELRPDVVHVVDDGQIQDSGGPDLASELDASFSDAVR